MKILKNEERVKRLQQGGQVAPAAAPAQGGEDQMLAQLEAMAAEIINSVGPEGAAMLAQMIMEMLQGAQQEMVGQPQGGTEPVFKRGGKISRRKACKK